MSHDAITQTSKPLPHMMASRPEVALIVYSNPDAGGTFVSSHKIIEDNHHHHLGPGTILTPHNQNRVIALLSQRPRNESLEYIDPCILAFNDTQLCWYVSPARRPMTFRLGEKEISMTVPWPGLVFHATTREGLRVAACTGTTRPVLETPLYHAPLMNIDDDGDLCFGNYPVPAQVNHMKRHCWEDAIFNTRFTHTNQDQTLHEDYASEDGVVSNTDHFNFWRNLEKTNAPSFPEPALNPMHLTVKDWIDA
jgi:PRTRC genetic system protein B